MNPAARIVRTLRSLRRRMVLHDFLRRTVRASLFFYAVLVVFTAAAWWSGGFRPTPEEIPFVLGWPPVLGAAAGLVIALLRRPALDHVARVADALGATRDRLLTGLQFSSQSRLSEFQSLAVAEAGEYVSGHDFRPLLPIRPPQELVWLAAPVAALALLWMDAMHIAITRDELAAEQTAAIEGTSAGLDRLASGLESQADASREAELRKLAERLRQSAGQMRAEAARGSDAQKTALRELALLEQWVKELRQPEAVTPDELKALADALMKHGQTRAAAEDIQAGNLAGASEKLERAADAHDKPSEAQIRQTIQQALDHLAQRKEEISRQLEQLREQANAGDGGRQDLLRQIAEMLTDRRREGNLARQKDEGKKGAGKPMTDRDLKQLLGALQDLKNNRQGGGSQEREPAKGETDSQERIAVLDFGAGKSQEGKVDDGVDSPTGLPGTEKDKSTTMQPFGKQGAEPGEAVQKDRLSGRLGAGESLSAAIPGVGGNAKATRRYKELYDAAAADAEDAVTQENIPLGSRLLIKRYFDAIRPRP